MGTILLDKRRVAFTHPQNGYEHHQLTAMKHLEVGGQYTLELADQEDWHTDYYLAEFPGVAFNSVMFDDVL